jgi:hypothetical protein
MLEFSGINFWAVLVAWIINVVVGSVWYSPVGFGRRWSKLSGVNMMKIPKDEANRAIAAVAVASFVQALVLAVVLHSLHVATSSTPLTNGLVTGLVLWFGLVAATTVGNNLYMRKSWKFWWLNASFFLVVMAVNSVLLTLWK